MNVSNDVAEPSKEGNKKPSTAQLCRVYSQVLNKELPLYPKCSFPRTFKRLDIPGSYEPPLLEIHENNTCRNVILPQIADAIIAFSMYAHLDYPELGMGSVPKNAMDYAKAWRGQAKSFASEIPPACVFASDNRLAYERLPFDPHGTLEDAPYSKEFLSRVEFADEFCEWIWSLFDQESSRAQWFWLHGKGGDGKSTFAAAIMSALGAGAEQLSTSDMVGNRFWKARLVGKRLVYIPEADPKMPRTQLMKELTGEGKLTNEKKGKDGFVVPNNCKFLFISNDHPQISSLKSDRRRALYSKVFPFKGEPMSEKAYQESVKAELPSFLNHCKAIYESKKRQSIEAPREMLLDLTDEFEMPAAELFEQYFETAKGEYVTASDAKKVFEECQIFSNRRVGYYYDIWESRFGVFKTSIWKDEAALKVLMNCRLKSRGQHTVRYYGGPKLRPVNTSHRDD